MTTAAQLIQKGIRGTSNHWGVPWSFETWWRRKSKRVKRTLGYPLKINIQKDKILPPTATTSKL